MKIRVARLPPTGFETPATQVETNRMDLRLCKCAELTPLWGQSYGYDVLRRLASVTSPAGQFAYDYVTRDLVYDEDFKYQYTYNAASQVRQLTLPNSAAITNDFDANGRLLAT